MFRFIYGCVGFRITSAKAETVINRLRPCVPILKMTKISPETTELYTVDRARKAVLLIAGDCGAYAEIISESGLPTFLRRLKKRPGLLLGIAVCTVGIILSSLVVWDVRVYGNQTVTDGEIKTLLSSLGVSEGRFINKQILERVYNSYLINEPRISWISVNYDGTVAKVEVKERNIVPERIDRTKNVNIVAKCDGIIRRIDTFDGKAEASRGEVVTKGQLLISSFVETRNTGIMMRSARGKVWAETVHKYDIYVAKNEYVKQFAPSHKNEKFLLLLGIEIPLKPFSSLPDGKFKRKHTTKQLSLSEKYPLPAKIQTAACVEYISQAVAVSPDEAKKKADLELAKKEEAELAKAEIIGRKEYADETDEYYVFHYELLCIENIAAEVLFEFE